MNMQGLTSAGITAFIALCTALLALFAQDGVVYFSDITPVAYASAVIGSLLAGATTYQARMKEKPE
jgi:hypothetical protein